MLKPLCEYLVQSGLQEFLPLLCPEQQVLPALVELLQLIPQVTGFIARRGLQQLRGRTGHRLHRGIVGHDVITQNLGQSGGRETVTRN